MTNIEPSQQDLSPAQGELVVGLLDGVAADIAAMDREMLRLSACTDQGAATVADLLGYLERWQGEPAARGDLEASVAERLTWQADTSRHSRLALRVAQHQLRQAAERLGIVRHLLDNGLAQRQGQEGGGS